MPVKKSRMKTNKNYVDQSFLKKYCNLRPDPLDPRDYPYGTQGIRVGAPQLPKQIDYSKETGPVGDQGRTGSCVGWATVYGLRNWLHYKSTGKKFKFSVRFGWMAAKEYDPFDINVPFDGAGTRIRDALKVMRKFGSPPDSLWPFSKMLPDPSKENKIKSEALKYRIGNYYALRTNEERRIHLAKEGPFAVGVPVYSNWINIGPDGLVPDPGGYLQGGHSVLVVGYDDNTQLFKFQNSWGKKWGKSGYGFFAYVYIEKYAWSSWGVQRL